MRDGRPIPYAMRYTLLIFDYLQGEGDGIRAANNQIMQQRIFLRGFVV